jgi:hypothetical protein
MGASRWFYYKEKTNIQSGPKKCIHSLVINIRVQCVYIFLGHSVYRIVILTIVLYGIETWSDILREEYMLRVLQNLVMRNVLRPHTGENIRRRREF